MPTTPMRDLFLESARACLELFGDPLLGAAWDEPSVLPEMRVGALVGHLSRGVLQVEWFLAADAPEIAPITAAQYYAPFSDSADLGSELNRAVRARGDERAELGQRAIVAEVGETLARLPVLFESTPEERTVEARGSSGVSGRVLLLDEYLKVRLVEQTIHPDDLVRSVPGLRLPVIPEEAYRVAIETLVGAAIVRHGPLGVLLGLARRERDEPEALRVL